ncbi:hypothetical protein CDAR_62061, partial [Caerostris darwini]
MEVKHGCEGQSLPRSTSRQERERGTCAKRISTAATVVSRTAYQEPWLAQTLTTCL